MGRMIATTTGGTVEGLELPGDPAILQFRNVPYAAAPTGARRLRPPQPVEAWEGVRDGKHHGKVAPQPSSPLESMLGAPPAQWDEDCLTLTVTTPSLEGSRPVLFWIHGGAFTAGTGATPWYDGAQLARKGDVVVVSINYRLGAFGFMHVGHLLGDDFADSGALGILDQIAALQWVRDNIAGLGGDPSRVTIFGESAGGMSVGSLLGSPLAQGLFSGAIAQSGAAHNANTQDAAGEIAALVLDKAGLSERGADGLLTLSAEDLVAAQSAAGLELMARRSAGEMGGGLPFQPVLGGSVLPQQPLDAVRAGSAADVRLVAGTTTEEWKLFALMARASEKPLDDARLRRRAERAFGEGAGVAVDTYSSNRPGASPDDIWSAMVTDFAFRIPALRLAEAQHAHTSDVYVYEFDHKSTAWGGALGACHAIEIPFVFDNLDARGATVFIGDVGDRERALATETSDAWLAFANGGQPGDRYDADRRATRRFGGDAPGTHDDPHGDERHLWDSLR
jgi:para-nitrobenzyl esterase